MLKTMRPIFIFAMYLTSFYIDYAVNGTDFINNTDKLISAADSKVKVLVIPTNEELAIARDTLALI